MGGCCATATTVLYLCVWCFLYPGRCHRPDTVPTPLHCPHSGSFPTLPPCRCCITRNSYYEALLSPSFFFLIHTLPHLFICSLPACKVAFPLFTSSVAVLSPTREILSFFQINSDIFALLRYRDAHHAPRTTHRQVVVTNRSRQRAHQIGVQIRFCGSSQRRLCFPNSSRFSGLPKSL